MDLFLYELPSTQSSRVVTLCNRHTVAYKENVAQGIYM